MGLFFKKKRARPQKTSDEEEVSSSKVSVPQRPRRRTTRMISLEPPKKPSHAPRRPRREQPISLSSGDTLPPSTSPRRGFLASQAQEDQTINPSSEYNQEQQEGIQAVRTQDLLDSEENDTLRPHHSSLNSDFEGNDAEFLSQPQEHQDTRVFGTRQILNNQSENASAEHQKHKTKPYSHSLQKEREGFSGQQALLQEDLGRLFWLQGVITAEEMKDSIEKAASDERRPEVLALLQDSGFVPAENLFSFLAERESLASLDFREVQPSEHALAEVQATIAKAFQVLPIAILADILLVAVSMPFEPEHLFELRQFTGKKIKLLIAPSHQLNQAIEFYYGNQQGALPDFEDPEVLPAHEGDENFIHHQDPDFQSSGFIIEEEKSIETTYDGLPTLDFAHEEFQEEQPLTLSEPEENQAENYFQAENQDIFPTVQPDSLDVSEQDPPAQYQGGIEFAGNFADSISEELPLEEFQNAETQEPAADGFLSTDGVDENFGEPDFQETMVQTPDSLIEEVQEEVEAAESLESPLSEIPASEEVEDGEAQEDSFTSEVEEDETPDFEVNELSEPEHSEWQDQEESLVSDEIPDDTNQPFIQDKEELLEQASENFGDSPLPNEEEEQKLEASDDEILGPVEEESFLSEESLAHLESVSARLSSVPIDSQDSEEQTYDLEEVDESQLENLNPLEPGFDILSSQDLEDIQDFEKEN